MDLVRFQESIEAKKSLLCIGLDPVIEKLPVHLNLNSDPVYSFCAEIIESTAAYAIAFKPNFGFFESLGPSGWYTLKKVIHQIPKDCLSIADAKRGDIGNTAAAYAKAVFDSLGADAITLSPYMGKDSILPFLEYSDKWSFVLSLTSNKGAEDFELQMLDSGMPLYRKVIEKSLEWSRNQKGILGFVAGATHMEQIEEIFQNSEGSFLLVPGIGAQGGDLDLLLQSTPARDKKAIISVSRSVIFASQGEDFAEMALKEARKLQSAINSLIF